MAKIQKATSAEKKIIDSRLKDKYPQMYNKYSAPLYHKKPGTLSRIASAIGKAVGGKKKKKKLTTARTKAITSKLKQAGVSDEEIKRLRGG